MKFWPFSRKENPVGSILVQNPGQAAFMNRNPASFAREGYQMNAIAFAAIMKRVVAMSSIPLQVCREVGGKQETLEKHPLIDLLKRPNPTAGGRAFLRGITSYLDIAGNSYIIRSPDDSVNEPQELWHIKPEQVKVITGSSGMPLAYEVKGTGDTRRYPVDQLTGKADILHIKTFNPSSHWYGMSPMEAAAYSIDTFNSAQKWNKKLLDNDAKPSGAFVVKDDKEGNNTLAEDQYQKLKEQIDRQMSGADNAGRPLLLEGGVDWVSMSMKMKDMDYEKNLLMAARWIASCYGVPPQLINIPGESTYSNFEQAQLAFWMNTVIPEMQTLLDELNNWLAPMFGEDISIKFDKDDIPALESARMQLFERLDKNSFMTVNEKRKAVGMDDITGGDVLLVEVNKVPISSVDIFNEEDGEE